MKYSRSIYEERLALFQHDIGELSAADIKPLPDLTDTINHKGGEPTPKNLAPGFYLAPKVFQALTTRVPDTRVEMLTDDAQKVTREDSRHQVFFGYLDFINPAGTTMYEANVAVKAVKAMQKEMAMYQMLGGLGINTFKPFGYIVMPNGNQHLLTKVRKQVTTIDATEWKSLCPEEIWETCLSGVKTEAILNQHGLFYGDLEFRNVATEENGKPVIIDPEFMTSYREVMDNLLLYMDDVKSFQRDEVRSSLGAIIRKMGVDFTAMTRSFKTFAMPALPHKLRPKNTGQLFEVLKKKFYDPYRDMLDSNERYYPVLKNAYDGLLVKRKEEARNGTL